MCYSNGEPLCTTFLSLEVILKIDATSSQMNGSAISNLYEIVGSILDYQ
jgi:hypothetical protein